LLRLPSLLPNRVKLRRTMQRAPAHRITVARVLRSAEF